MPRASVTAEPNSTPAVPRDLAAALTAASGLLDKRAKVFEVVTETHDAYPLLLRRRAEAQAAVDAAELHGGNPTALQAARDKLAEVEHEKRRVLSRRAGALEFLVAQEKTLLTAKEALDAARTSYTMSVVKDFNIRWDAEVARLQALRAEALALTSVLRAEVPTPPPYRIEGGQAVGLHPWPPDVGPTRLVPVESDTPPAVTLDPNVAKLGSVLDGLVAALTYISGVSQHRRLEAQPPRSTNRTGPDPTAIYVAQKDLMVHADGLPITAGTWTDVPFLGYNTVTRHLTSKSLIPIEPKTAEVAA